MNINKVAFLFINPCILAAKDNQKNNKVIYSVIMTLCIMNNISFY